MKSPQWDEAQRAGGGGCGDELMEQFPFGDPQSAGCWCLLGGPGVS